MSEPHTHTHTRQQRAKITNTPHSSRVEALVTHGQDSWLMCAVGPPTNFTRFVCVECQNRKNRTRPERETHRQKLHINSHIQNNDNNNGASKENSSVIIRAQHNVCNMVNKWIFSAGKLVKMAKAFNTPADACCRTACSGTLPARLPFEHDFR